MTSTMRKQCKKHTHMICHHDDDDAKNVCKMHTNGKTNKETNLQIEHQHYLYVELYCTELTFLFNAHYIIIYLGCLQSKSINFVCISCRVWIDKLSSRNISLNKKKRTHLNRQPYRLIDVREDDERTNSCSASNSDDDVV